MTMSAPDPSTFSSVGSSGVTIGTSPRRPAAGPYSGVPNSPDRPTTRSAAPAAASDLGAVVPTVSTARGRASRVTSVPQLDTVTGKRRAARPPDGAACAEGFGSLPPQAASEHARATEVAAASTRPGLMLFLPVLVRSEE